MNNPPRLLTLGGTLAAAMVFFAAGCTKPVETAGAAPATSSIGTDIDDSVITAGVKVALLGDDKVKSYDIAVITRKGEVQLSGFVDSQSQIDRAVIITRAIQGVERVSNEMSIKK